MGSPRECWVPETCAPGEQFRVLAVSPGSRVRQARPVAPGWDRGERGGQRVKPEPWEACLCVRASRLVCVTPSGERDNIGFLIFSFSLAGRWPYQERTGPGNFPPPAKATVQRPSPGHLGLSGAPALWKDQAALPGLLTWQPGLHLGGNQLSTWPDPGPRDCHTGMHTPPCMHPYIRTRTLTHVDACVCLPLS